MSGDETTEIIGMYPVPLPYKKDVVFNNLHCVPTGLSEDIIKEGNELSKEIEKEENEKNVKIEDESQNTGNEPLHEMRYKRLMCLLDRSKFYANFLLQRMATKKEEEKNKV